MSEASQPTRRYRRRQQNDDQQQLSERPLVEERLISGGSSAPSATLREGHGLNNKNTSEPEEKPLLAADNAGEVEMAARKTRFRRDRQDNNENNDNNVVKVPPLANNKPVIAERRTLNQPTANETREVFSPPIVKFPLSLVNRTLWFNIGYRMEQYQRSQGLNKLKLYSREDSDGYVVGFNIISIPDCCTEIMQMVRPFVRIHIVNINSGMYVKSVRKFAAKTASTWSFLLNDPQSSPVWNQELLIDTNYEDVVHEDTLVLFEVLDQKPSINVKREMKAAAKRVAWGFLLPISTNNKTINFGINSAWVKNDTQRGVSGTTGNVDDGTTQTHEKYSSNSHDKLLHIQLYRFKHHENIVGNLQRQVLNWTKGDKYSSGASRDDPSYPDGVPEVYIQWRKQQRSIIKGCTLKLAVGPRESSDNVHNVAIGETVITGNVVSSPQRAISMTMPTTEEMSKDINKVRTAILKRSRVGKEPCVIPDRLLHRLEVGPEGAMVVAFSHIGHLLAVASKSTTLTPPFSDQISLISNPNIIYGLHLFDVDMGTEVWFESIAHHGVIYDIKWSEDDCHLLTCSGDGTVKVWDVSSFNISSHNKNNADGTLPSPRGVSLMQQLYLHSQQAQQDGKAPGGALVQTLTTTPPLFIYCAIFQEYGTSSDSSTRSAALPKIITGASDGRLRVYNNGSHVGNIRISDDADDFPPHEGNVNAVTIDQRSKYLVTSDSAGEIFVWRLDSRGWYQLLRKLKRELDYGATSPRSKSMNSGQYPGVSGVISLKMHPDKFKGQLLAYSMPSSLKLYSMSTYRCVSTCAGAGINSISSIFSRAEISADGNYAVCGGSSKFNKHTYSLRFWESSTGHTVPSALSEIEFPYPIRSVAWHPRQHMLAVSMVGQGAAVVIYCAERDTSDKMITKKVNAAIVEIANLKKDKEVPPTAESSKENIEQKNEAKVSM